MSRSVITPYRRFFDVDITGLWNYRDLYVMYIRRDIVIQYKQTILGPLWYIIQPVMTTIMYMFVFGGLAGISTDGAPQALFYLSGILLWNYFSQCFIDCSDVFVQHASVFGKVYFPRLVVPLASCTSGLIRLLIQFILFLIVYFYYRFFIPQGSTLTIGTSILLFPFLILLLGFLGLSWGLVISSLTAKYRDLKFLIQFGLQLFMYATPVIYPLSVAPEHYRSILSFNPLTPIFETFKFSMLSCGSLDWSGLFYACIFTFISLILAVIVFARTERNFMDTV